MGREREAREEGERQGVRGKNEKIGRREGASRGRGEIGRLDRKKGEGWEEGEGEGEGSRGRSEVGE